MNYDHLINRYKISRGACQVPAEPCQMRDCRYHIHGDAKEDQTAVAEPLTVACALRLADLGGLTLEEVGSKLGLTRERVRQIEMAGLKKLGARLEREGCTKGDLAHWHPKG